MSHPTRILIIGTGFGGIYVLKNLHKYFCGGKEVSISIVGEKDYFLFTPLLHEVATGGVKPDNIIEPVERVLGCCIGRFLEGRAEKINLEEKIVEVSGEKVPYDFLVLAPGAETNFYNIPGANNFTYTLKNLEDAKKIKNALIATLKRGAEIKDRAERKKILSFAVVGGGPTGVELVAEMEEFLRGTSLYYYPKEVVDDISILLIHKDAELLPQFDKKLREKSLKVLQNKNIKVMLNTEVKEVKYAEIITANENIHAQVIVWVAGIKPREFVWESNTPQMINGKLKVTPDLSMQNFPEVFALGDFAHVEDNSKPVPALAQVATKEAKIVAQNIKLAIQNRPLKSFTYKSSGSLVSLGQWLAVGEVFGFHLSGRFAWWLWRTVYLFKIISWKKRFKVAKDWTLDLFRPRDISPLE